MSWYARLAVALAVGTLGGAVFRILHLPLPWMLGSMTACMIASMAGLPAAIPGRLRPFMSSVVGAMLGTTFTTAMIGDLADLWASLLGLFVFLLVSASCCYVYLRRAAGFPPMTALFAAMPGGITDIVLMSEERGADERRVALVHATRIFMIVLTFPLLLSFLSTVEIGGARAAMFRGWDSMSPQDFAWFIAAAVGGVWFGTLVRMPARNLLGPMMVSAAMHMANLTDFVIPSGAVSCAQIVIGSAIGCRFQGITGRDLLRTIAVAFGSSLLLATISICFAMGLERLTGFSFAALLLAYAPAGMSEMSLVALALHVEVPFVVLHQVARIFLAIGVLAILSRWLSKT
ncbi:MAG: AbrB family transcriptional regulator [Rhodobacteraceae bacterium]|nr:AbrB family transcriptional regulator [Paracoccaceae bacterium]